MYLYLGIRDAAYLQLRDQNTALVAAAELSARKALSTQNTLEPLLRRFGLNGNTDLVGVQRMRRAMLDLDASAPTPSRSRCRSSSASIEEHGAPQQRLARQAWRISTTAPKRPENPHASNFECDLDAASNAPTVEADEELAPIGARLAAQRAASAAPIPSVPGGLNRPRSPPSRVDGSRLERTPRALLLRGTPPRAASPACPTPSPEVSLCGALHARSDPLAPT